MIEIFSRRNASNVLPVMWTVGELAMPYVRHDVGGSFGGTDTDSYLAMNPNGRIPTIRDGDFVLWESNAIVRYLCRQYDKNRLLLPDTEQAYALADQWMDWYKTTLYPVYIELTWAIVRTEPVIRDNRRIAEYKGQTEAQLSILDEHLSNSEYLIGNSLSMADIPFGALAFRYFELEINHPDFPNIRSWFKQLTQRPAFKAHVMFDFGRDPGEWYRLEREGQPDKS